jgi:hypothetical protein
MGVERPIIYFKKLYIRGCNTFDLSMLLEKGRNTVEAFEFFSLRGVCCQFQQQCCL